MANEVKLVESLAPATTAQVGKRWRARIIQGDAWGSSAYYPSEVLERDGARIFTAGLQMYMNHATEQEQYDRPERRVQDMVGKLTSDAIYENDGLYADVEFYDTFVADINEKALDIGLSVHADGLTEHGEMDGRSGPVLVALLGANSVDVVTRAGAGGKLTSILESDRNLAGSPIETNKEGSQSMTVTKEDFEALSATLLEAITAIPVALAESLKATKDEEAKVERVEGEKPETDEREEVKSLDESAEEKVEIDHAAIVEALATHTLPAKVASAIVTALEEGETLEAAVQKQVELREAFASAGQVAGTIVLSESDKPTGLARSVTVLS